MGLTQGERAALRWLLAVFVAGAGVKLYRQWRFSGDATPAAAEALSRQLLAVDSAQRQGRRARNTRSAGRQSTSGRRTRTPARPRADSAAALASSEPTLSRVDLDVADSAALERLPRIGPALASRIVADRQAHGAFGSLRALQRVRGIGAKLAGALEGHVTFSGNPRPSTVQR